MMPDSDEREKPAALIRLERWNEASVYFLIHALEIEQFVHIAGEAFDGALKYA